MEKGRRIAFGHRKRVGKGEACAYLGKFPSNPDHPLSFRVAFADPLYQIHDYTLGVCSFPIEKDRELLRALGKWGRERQPGLWVNLLIDQVKRLDAEEPECDIYVEDVRFPDEAEALKKQGFTLVKIVRPGVEKDSDVSETALCGFEGWDLKLINNGSLEDYHEKLDKYRYFYDTQ